MSVVIPPGFAQVGIQWRNSGDPEPWYTTYGIDVSDSGGDWGPVATLQSNFAYTAFGAHMSNTTTLSVVVLRIGQDGGDPLTLNFPINAQCGSAAAKLPQNCAALVDKQTNRSGRTGKGRMFLPSFLDEASVDNVGVVAGPYRNTRQTAIDQGFGLLLSGNDPQTTAPTPMVLLHNEGVPQGTAPTPVNSIVLQNLISTQRRRLR